MSEEDKINVEMTDAELKQLAQDMHAGRIYTDRHLPKGLAPHMIFLPLVFLDEKQSEQFKRYIDEEKVFMIYEYMDQAGPRSLNGQPQFMSYRVLNKEQTIKLFEYYEKIKKAIEEIK